MVEVSEDLLRAYALENALKYKGKANEKAVLAGLFSEGLDKSEIKKYIPSIVEMVEQVNKLSTKEQKEALEALDKKTSKRDIREGLPELENVSSKGVVMRFAPFPSGPLHIGNARTLILNDEYVKKYGGKLLLVMDDTLGSEKKPIEPEAYDLIEEGARWLGSKIEKKVYYKSDRIEKYYEYAVELLKKGYMYVCDCEADERRELKAKGIACGCRQMGPEEQIERWGKMFKSEEGAMCARLKTSISDPDPAFRDRVMFRVSDRNHARLGKKYRVYPLLDFSWAIDDHFFGMTHILRGMELAIETRTQNFIWDIFEWEHPEVIYNGHFELEGVKISKSKGAQEVKSGTYEGWNDPRLWSVQSLRDRGIKKEAIRQFIIDMGLKKTNIKSPVDVLYSINRKFLENTKKYFFVEDPEKIKIRGCPELDVNVLYNPNRKVGSRRFSTKGSFFISKEDYDSIKNKTYRLLHLLNFKVDNIVKLKPKDFSFLSTEPISDRGLKFIHWLPANEENVKVEVVMTDASRVEGLGEASLRKLKEGAIVQLERFGYVRLHKKDVDKMEFRFAHK
jgi:glutamyl-tRNA synthetase